MPRQHLLGQRFFPLALFLFHHRPLGQPPQEPPIPLLDLGKLRQGAPGKLQQPGIPFQDEFPKGVPGLSHHKLLHLHSAKEAQVLPVQPVEGQRSYRPAKVHECPGRGIAVPFLNHLIHGPHRRLERGEVQVQNLGENGAVYLHLRDILHPVALLPEPHSGAGPGPGEVK